MRKILGAAGLGALALALSACASSSSSSSTPATSAPATSAPAAGASSPASSAPASVASAGALKLTTINGTAVVTNSKGMTLYWFVPDTSTASKCTGSCATYWPPVTGPVTAGSGVTGTLSTITRPDGTTQATYDGHPLYTYAGDSAAGQAKGNGLNVSGGLWWEMTVSGAKPANSTSSNTSSNTGGGTSTSGSGGGSGGMGGGGGGGTGGGGGGGGYGY
jgi:predicted lipoprotein with Yx(FWY)xxD motif